MDLSLKIIRVKEYNNYILQDMQSNKIYSLVLEFYGIDKPAINDILLLNETLVDSKSDDYSQPYAFEIMNEDDFNLKDIDLAGLIAKDKKYILKRIYG